MKKITFTLILSLAAAGTLVAQSTATTPAPFFDGAPTPADKAVMAQAAKDIEKYRKGAFVLRLVDASGKPVEGKAVVADLERHQFDFGTNSFGLSAMKDDDPLKKIARQTILDIFNSVVVVNYWHNPQTAEEADLSKKDLAWAQTNGLRTRFHAVLYNDPFHIFVGKDLSNRDAGKDFTADQCWKIMEDRVKYVTAITGAKGMEYDVINEMISKKLYWDKDKPDAFMKLVPNFPDLTDPQVVKRVYNMVRGYLPTAQLVGLETQLPSLNNPLYMAILDYWKRVIAAGADIDVVGTQCHFFNKDRIPFQEGTKAFGPDTYTMSGISPALDTLRSLGKPIVITEFNGPSRSSADKPDVQEKYWTMSDRESAAWQINFYKLAFSKPFIIGLTRWYQVDKFCGKAIDGGIITRTGEKRQIYFDLKKLIKEEWHTRVADKSGVGN